MRGAILEKLRENRIIAALRKVPVDKIERTVEALYRGGIRMVEVTFDQSDKNGAERTCESIRIIKRHYKGLVQIGAGTVMSVEQLKAAGEAGAEYILAPDLNADVVLEAVKTELPCIPGALTPSEIAAAWAMGAELVKVFPAGNLGTGYLRALSGPLGHIPLLGMGGIDSENMTDYLSLPNLAGVGIGANIVREDMILRDDYEGLQELARKYTSVCRGNMRG